jgi:hypothetical protein
MARKPPYPTEAATRRDRLVMAVVSLTENDDWERVRLSTHPKFLAIIERSRAAHTSRARGSRQPRCGDGSACWAATDGGP